MVDTAARLVGLVNPAAGGALAMLSAARAARHREPEGGVLSQTFGKSLTHHQVLPAVHQPRVANAPRTDFGKAVLSGTGGNPRAVNQAVHGIRSRVVSQISPFARRGLLRENFTNALKHTPHSKNFNSN